jgi:hypothetical protein
VSENNRKARFYTITRSGKKQLTIEARNWERISAVIGKLLGSETCVCRDARDVQSAIRHQRD